MECSPPAGYSKLRACLVCKLLKTEDQWLKEGCGNCPGPDNIKDIERVQEYTSAVFEGVLSLMHPEKSWAGKWNFSNFEQLVPGCYAIDVVGSLPEGMPGEEEEEDEED